MSAHTPGPWVVSPFMPGSVVDETDTYQIAQCPLPPGARPDGVAIQAANTRLVAAAPEMAAALEAVLAEAHPHRASGCAFCKARVVLAKARGAS